MGRARIPTAIHELKGTFLKHPERRRPYEPQPDGPVGDPPLNLNKDQIEAWHRIVHESPPGVLTRHDRIMVEMGARILAELTLVGDLLPAKWARLESILSRLGMSPVDRSKVASRPSEEAKSPWDDLGVTPQ